MPEDTWSDDLPFTQASIRRYVPPTHTGLYSIESTSRGAVYIGSAEDIQGRLIEHCNGTSDQAQCIYEHDPTHYRFTLEPSLASCVDTEEVLIEMHSPLCNKK